MVILKNFLIIFLFVLSCKQGKCQTFYNSQETTSSVPFDTLNLEFIKTCLFSVGDIEFSKKNKFQGLKKTDRRKILEIDFISGWSKRIAINTSETRLEYLTEINSQENDIKLEILVARYPFSIFYESYLLMVEQSDKDGFLKIKELFLLNQDSERIISLIKLSSYYLFEGDCIQTYSTLFKDDILIFFEERISSDAIILSELNNPEKVEPKKLIKSIIKFNRRTGNFTSLPTDK
jgi:hypothetical protein